MVCFCLDNPCYFFEFGHRIYGQSLEQNILVLRAGIVVGFCLLERYFVELRTAGLSWNLGVGRTAKVEKNEQYKGSKKD